MSSLSYSYSYVSPDEYLEAERNAEAKSEYINGQVYAMAGASPNHVRITVNVTSGLHAQLRGRPCEVFSTDLRVKVAETGMYAYPDVAALCGPPRFDDRDAFTLVNPQVIVEVLSPSTEAFDRGAKFSHYRALNSLREYLLISQDKPLVEYYVRQGEGNWLFRAVSGLDSVVVMPSLGCELTLSDIYDHVQFPLSFPESEGTITESP